MGLHFGIDMSTVSRSYPLLDLSRKFDLPYDVVIGFFDLLARQVSLEKALEIYPMCQKAALTLPLALSCLYEEGAIVHPFRFNRLAAVA